MFRPRHPVMLKKCQLFPALKLTQHCNAKKIPKFYAICPRPGHLCSQVPGSHPPPSRPPCPRPPNRPCSQRSRTTGTNQREGTMGQGHRLQGEQSNFVWYRARNDDITANKRQQPYHTYLCRHTAPHRRGGANQNDHRPHPQAGGGDKARNGSKRGEAPFHRGGGGEGRRNQTRPDGESNKAKPDNYPLDRQGGIPWGGGGGEGVWQPCIIDARFFEFLEFFEHYSVL